MESLFLYFLDWPNCRNLKVKPLEKWNQKKLISSFFMQKPHKTVKSFQQLQSAPIAACAFVYNAVSLGFPAYVPY